MKPYKVHKREVLQDWAICTTRLVPHTTARWSGVTCKACLALQPKKRIKR